MDIKRVQEKLNALAKLDIHRDVLVCGKGFQLRSVANTGIKFTTLQALADRVDELLLREIQSRKSLEGLLD